MLAFAFDLQLDSVKRVSSRAFILQKGQSLSQFTWNTDLTKGVQDCVTYNAYIEVNTFNFSCIKKNVKL